MDANAQVYALEPYPEPSNRPQPCPVEWRSAVFPPRRPIYHAGQVADKVLVVRSGIVALMVHLPNGRSRIVGLQGAGAVLGALGDGENHYSHSALPVRTVRADWVFSGTVRLHREAMTRWYVELLEQRCAGMRRAERWIAEFTAGNTRCRVARLVAFLAELEGDSSEVELLTCQQIGETVGVSTETASRVLADFKRGGLLRASEPAGRNRYQLDRRRLADVAFG